MKSIIYKTIKITLAILCALYIAFYFKLEFALSAGIITLLTMLDMKRQSIGIATKRLYTGIIAIILSSILFATLGFSLIVFGVFLVLYIPLLLKLEASVGLVVNTVIVTHIYSLGNITWNGLLNEVWIILLGIVVALVFNLHMPNIEEEIKLVQRKIEEQLKAILLSMSYNLKNYCEIDDKKVTLKEFKSTIKEGKGKARIFLNSYYLKDYSYYLEYFEMRQQQYYRLKYMEQHFKSVFITQNEANILGEFTSKIAEEIHEFNNGGTLLLELYELRMCYKQSELPKTREEFENRASLFQYLNDLEEVINIKRRFMEGY